MHLASNVLLPSGPEVPVDALGRAKDDCLISPAFPSQHEHAHAFDPYSVDLHSVSVLDSFLDQRHNAADSGPDLSVFYLFFLFLFCFCFFANRSKKASCSACMPFSILICTYDIHCAYMYMHTLYVCVYMVSFIFISASPKDLAFSTSYLDRLMRLAKGPVLFAWILNHNMRLEDAPWGQVKSKPDGGHRMAGSARNRQPALPPKQTGLVRCLVSGVSQGRIHIYTPPGHASRTPQPLLLHACMQNLLPIRPCRTFPPLSSPGQQVKVPPLRPCPKGFAHTDISLQPPSALPASPAPGLHMFRGSKENNKGGKQQ